LRGVNNKASPGFYRDNNDTVSYEISCLKERKCILKMLYFLCRKVRTILTTYYLQASPMKKYLFIVSILLILSHSNVKGQEQYEGEGLKQAAINHMDAGRYGEAIDLLNKYISANPREANGYYLRAQSFEKRSQYQESVLDYRRASRLEPQNQQILADLNRVLEVWHALLYRKIEGHQREIAIDPAIPFNYLEIGKSYRWLEIWDKAEEWYDEYLARDDNASPDEIIRYTEILAKTGSIVKGERILKIFVERYPGDWRLWSRYGYFTLWLGKYRIAKDAFETALSFKPFFKEAQDGLDLAKQQAYVTQYDPRAFEKEFPIDRYYRLLRKDSSDYETRYKLVDELIKADRLEEAYTQLQILGVDFYADDRYNEKWDYLVTLRDSTYREKIEVYQSRIDKNASDREAVRLIAQYYEYLLEYEKAMEILDRYFSIHPDEKESQLRFQYSKSAAWNRDFDKAIVIIDNLLTDVPNNLDYQLFRAQLSVWNTRDLELAHEYLTNVLTKQPENLDALISMGSLKLIDRKYDEAQQYADKAKKIDPVSEHVIKLQSDIDFQRLRAEEERLYLILEEGRKRVLDDDCEGALSFYEDYFSQAEPNNLILKEYGDIQFCAKHYDKALEIYSEVLSYGYNRDAVTQRAKVYYSMGDSLNAVKEFKTLVEEDSSDFDARLYLGDSYAKLGENDSARAHYDTLLTWQELDSTQIAMVEMRKKWLPVSGLEAFFDTFPNYIGFGPSASFYSDNLNLRFRNIGGRLELGLTGFLSVGASFFRTFINSDQGYSTFTSFRGNLLFRLAQSFSLGFGFGSVNSMGLSSNREVEAFFRYEKKDTLAVYGNYNSTDAALILYSPDLLNTRIPASLFRINGYYIHSSRFVFSGYFQYVKIREYSEHGDNAGNDLQLRIGYLFSNTLTVGYEYFYSNYRYDSDFYYSPRDFESHCIWGDFFLERTEDLKVSFGGKIGTIPGNPLLIFEAHAESEIRVYETLTINARFGFGSTTRDDSSYKFFSGQVTAYMSL